MPNLGLASDLRAVLRGARWTMIIQVTAAGLSFGSQVLLARWMGLFEFGVYVFAWSIIPPLAVAAALGLSDAAVRFVPQYLTEDNLRQLRGLIRRSVAIVLFVGLAVAVMAWLVLAVLDARMADYYVGPLRLAVVCVPFLALIVLLSGLSRGFGRAGLAYVPQMLAIPGLVLAAAGVFTLWVGQPDAVDILLIAIGACVVTTLVTVIGFRKAMPEAVRRSRPGYDARLWLRVAVPLFLSDGIFLLLWNIDSIMLGSMMGPNEVSVYHACVRTSGLTLMVLNAITAFAVPRFAALLVDDDPKSQQAFVRSIAAWTFWPTLAVVAGLILLGPFILGMFGPEFVVGQPALVVLAIGYLSRAVTGPTVSYLAVSGNQDSVVVIQAAGAVSNILLNLLLIPPMGVLGAAIASVLSILIANIWSYVLVRRRLGLNPFFAAG